MDPITKAYLEVINESAKDGVVDSTKKQVSKPFGDVTGNSEKNTKNFVKDSGEDKAKKDLENTEEAPCHLSSDTSESTPKPVKNGEKLTLKGEGKNPFDILFSKIISENNFEFSTEADNELTPDSDFGGPTSLGGGHESDDEDHDFEHLEDDNDDEEDSLEDLLSKIKELVSKVEEKISPSEESEEGEESEEDDESFDKDDSEDHEDEEELNEEEVDAEILGHSLIDQERLEGGLTKKGTYTVKGAVPVTKKSAQVVKGKKVDGKPENFENKAGVEHLQKKSNHNAGGVKTGKFAVEDQS
jgi:hypothetical protein